MVELLSGYRTLPKNVPLSSYQYGSEIRVCKYQEALESLRQLVAKADDPSEVTLHSLSIGAATTLVARGEVPQTVIQRYGKLKSSGIPSYIPGIFQKARV